MTYKTLISTKELVSELSSDHSVVIDCRFDLFDTGEGNTAYQLSHIPGAFYAHLENDLSGKIIAGKTGRHPLPLIADLNVLFSSWGIDRHTQVVAYDNITGPFAARLWWMLKWMGHENVAVLDGGWKKWIAGGHSATANIPDKTQAEFSPETNPHLLASVTDVENAVSDSEICLLDARTADRFAGENETIDPVAGHIPTALSAPFVNNLKDTGELKDKSSLVDYYQGVYDANNCKNTIVYCGSGVTAAHNILAMKIAGMTRIQLYADSWSHWITDADHGVET